MVLMNELEIAEKVRALKMSKQRVQSNCYRNFSDSGRSWEVFQSDLSLCVIYRDNGVNRVLFYTLELDDLIELLRKNLFSDREYVLEIVSKEADMYESKFKKLVFAYLLS